MKKGLIVNLPEMRKGLIFEVRMGLTVNLIAIRKVLKFGTSMEWVTLRLRMAVYVHVLRLELINLFVRIVSTVYIYAATIVRLFKVSHFIFFLSLNFKCQTGSQPKCLLHLSVNIISIRMYGIHSLYITMYRIHSLYIY